MWKSKAYLRTTNRAKRRRHFRVLKVVGIILLFASAVFGLSRLSFAEFLSIREVEVVGNTIVSSEEIKITAREALSGSYWGLFSRSNIFLYSRRGVVEAVLRDFSKIKDVRASARGLQSVQIKITEYVPKATWCAGVSIDSCYFLDESGYIFSEAPDFSKSVYLMYRGLLEPALGSSTAIVGRSFLPAEAFAEITGFVSVLDELGLEPQEVSKSDEGNYYTVSLSSGSRVFVENQSGLATTSETLLSLVVNGVLPLREKTFLKNLDYLDLRYNNKIFYKLRNSNIPTASETPIEVRD